MNLYWYCLVSKTIAAVGFVTLVIYDHWILGLLCFLLAAGIDDGDIVKGKR